MSMMFKMMITLSIMSLTWWRKNIIMILMSLEILLLTIFTILASNNLNDNPMLLLIMLTLMVSGSSLGLSLLIMINHTHKSISSIFMWNLIFDKKYYTINHYNIY